LEIIEKKEELNMSKTEKTKAAYMITSGNITDPTKMAEYLEHAKPLFLKAGAEEVAFGIDRAENIDLLEGAWDFPGLVMIFKFPSMAAVREFWDSPEYQVVKDFRDNGVVAPNFTIAIEDRETW
jgi:uncharacterized protein (DUF1330 family)